MQTLPTAFYQIPNTATTTMTKEDLRELLLATNGIVIACGRTYEIKSKHLGAGVYRVNLKRLIA